MPLAVEGDVVFVPLCCGGRFHLYLPRLPTHVVLEKMSRTTAVTASCARLRDTEDSQKIVSQPSALKKLKGSPGLKCFYYGRFQDRHLCVNVGLFTCCRHPCILGLRVGKERIRMSWILRFTPRFVTVACFSETLSFLVEIYFGSAFNNPRSQDDSAMGF